MTRTLITGGIIINASASYRADVLIDNDQIVGIGRDSTLIPGDKIIDATDCYVLPGIIDAHTHIQLDTGIFQTADTWEIGTQAAAWGGVTTVIDFATQLPDQSLEAAVQARQAEAANAVIDYGLHCMITSLPYGEDHQLKTLIELGVTSYKLFTTYRPNYYLDDATILRVMNAAAKYGGVVMVHCENDAIISEMTAALVAQGKTGLAYHGRSRPVLAEEEAVNRVLYLAESAHAPVYIVHCSSANSVKQVRLASQRGVTAYCETCPQYLMLDESLYLSDAPEFYILQPPLRAKENSTGLWKMLSAGAIDVISTDHCDYNLTQKRSTGEFASTPGGLPGLETLLPLMYTHSVDKARVALTGLVRMLSANPARIFGLADRKGDIRAGLDADIVIYDPKPRTHVHAEDMHTVAGYSPYEGHRLRGQVRTVMCRGQLVIEDRQFVGTAGYGQFIPGKL